MPWTLNWGLNILLPNCIVLHGQVFRYCKCKTKPADGTISPPQEWSHRFFFIVKEWLGSFKRILTFSCFKDQDSPGMRIIALVPISSSFYKWRDRLWEKAQGQVDSRARFEFYTDAKSGLWGYYMMRIRSKSPYQNVPAHSWGSTINKLIFWFNHWHLGFSLSLF